ncbi:MAG: hypothetical protein IJY40_03525 [Oscillospiraceae bacterium]|nr:hypothetical protein [Oscillospiraceae bacterium]
MSFTNILNLSIAASWLVLAVAVIRLIWKNGPKAFHCALWALVAIRLLCPVSIESTFSLIPSREVVPAEYLYLEPREPQFREPARLEIVTNPVYDAPVEIEIDTTVDRFQHWDMLATVAWLAGMGVMAIYAVYSYWNLRLRVRLGARVWDNVWECDEISSPFILGLFRPRIYLPSSLDVDTRTMVLAHERAHLDRLDHLWKPLGFALLAVHWFNPVIWLGYILLCRDIELACDEKVIKRLDKPTVRAYSEALVRFAVPQRSIALCPLAFGEVGVKDRIKAMVRYRKPGLILTAAAVILAILLAACFLTDPVEMPTETEPVHVEEPIDAVLHEDGVVVTENIRRELDIMFYIDWLPAECFTPDGYSFQEGELTLYESDTTILEMTRVIPDGEQLRFDFRFRYDLPECGTILLPCHINIKGVNKTLWLTGSVHDYTRSYDSGVSLVQDMDLLGFTLLIDRELVENADQYLSIELDQLWDTTYVPNDVNILDHLYHVDEVLYQDERLTLSGTAAYAPAYIVERNLHLTALEQGSRWEIRRDMGELVPIKLEETNFNSAFLREYLPENRRAWLCTAQEWSHLLLQQTDGELYLAVLRENGTVLSDFYRLSTDEIIGYPPETLSRTFALDITDSFDIPSFTLYSDGTFQFTQSVVSSYLGYGYYLWEADSLVMKTFDGRCTWKFHTDGSVFYFDAAHSSPISYFQSLPDGYTELHDGAIFRSGSTHTEPESTLEEILNEAILEYNRADEDEGFICVENHEVLGELIACGTATVDGTPLEILTVYLAGEYRTYDARIIHKRMERFCGVITLESSGDGYQVTDYIQTEANDSETIFPEHIQELYEERYGIIQDWTSQENRYDAQAILYRSQGLETDIGTLIDTICSSPAQSSNPGDYIAAHQEEFDRLVSLGTRTIRYCFAEFARGGQIGLEGHIMALACREIIPVGTHVHDIPYESCLTGQDWFDQFAKLARSHRNEMGQLELEERHSYCFMALEALGI